MTRVAVVLSGGGLRGAGHIGVLQQLIAHGIPIDVIVGSSAGAVIAAYYAAVGLTLDELIADAQHFRGRHLLAHSLNVRLHQRFDRAIGKLTGVIPARLEQLERASFDRLHHGVQGIGIVCHDVRGGRACYFSTGNHRDVRLSDVVRASASVPLLFPSRRVDCCGESLLLTDGGVSDCLPIAFAQRPPLSATHLIVSDCRWFAGRPFGAGLKASTTTDASTDSREISEHLVYVRPRLFTTGTLWAPSSTLVEAVRQGAAAVTDEMLERLGRWHDTLPRDAGGSEKQDPPYSALCTDRSRQAIEWTSYHGDSR
jgi:predicted acylesterase/phospholipase RssA